MTSDKQFLTAKEVVRDFLGEIISYQTLLSLTKQGAIPCITIGKRRYYRREDLVTWVRQTEEK